VVAETRSPLGQKVALQLHPEAHKVLTLNHYLDADVWEVLWKNTNKADECRNLVSDPLNLEQVELVLRKEMRSKVISFFARYTLLTPEQIQALSQKSGISKDTIQGFQRIGEFDRVRRAKLDSVPRWFPESRLAEAHVVTMDVNSLQPSSAAPVMFILDQELDSAGRSAWETAFTLLAGGFEGSVDDLVRVATLL
jgi:hypothetical protein